MKIYRVRFDVERYQWLIPEDESLWASGLLTFDCQRKGGGWQAPSVYVQNPKLEPGDFCNFAPGALVARPSGLEVVQDLFERAGELVPLALGQERLTLLNVVECVNCLDEGASTLRYGYPGRTPIGVEQYEFHVDRLSESTLFKIPQTSRAEVLTVEGLKDAHDEFKPVVERAGLRGLEFDLLWESV